MKKILVIIMPIFLLIFLISGCKSREYYRNTEIKDFKYNMVNDFKDIKSISASTLAVDFSVIYELKDDISDDVREKIFEKTREYLKKDSFIKAINNEAKRDTFFKQINIEFINSSTSYHYIYSCNDGSDLKKWNIGDVESKKTIEKTYKD